MGLFGAAHGLGWGEKLALGMALKFDPIVGKGSKLKVKVLGVTPMFEEVRGERLVAGAFLPPIPPS